jgi:hypothetical protein
MPGFLGGGRNYLFLRQIDVKFCCWFRDVPRRSHDENLLTPFPQWKRTSLEIAVQYF